MSLSSGSHDTARSSDLQRQQEGVENMGSLKARHRAVGTQWRVLKTPLSRPTRVLAKARGQSL